MTTPIATNLKFLYCPECVETRAHPQPFQDAVGRWVCGACWFLDRQEVEMQESPIVFPLDATPQEST